MYTAENRWGVNKFLIELENEIIKYKIYLKLKIDQIYI
jgi:hypothetical protein